MQPERTTSRGVVGSAARALAAAALALTLAPAEPVGADQSDPRLPGLFEDLLHADSPRAGEMLEMRIWAIWMSSSDPGVEALLERGGRAMAEGALDRAVADFSEVIELQPRFAEGWNKRATAHYLRRDFAASMRDIRRTLALEPRHFGAISGMGLIFMERGDLSAALDAFEQVLSIHPQARGARRYRDALRRELGVGSA